MVTAPVHQPRSKLDIVDFVSPVSARFDTATNTLNVYGSGICH
jgi:hypothetical protein